MKALGTAARGCLSAHDAAALKGHAGHRIRATLAAMVLLLAADGAAQAQREPGGAQAVFLEADAPAAKMLGAARDFLAARQYADAVDLLRQISEQHGERLVAIEPARYVNVQTYVDILVSNLPPEGLKLYRERVDPQARRWYETAKRLRDEAGLERVVRKALMSSYGDDALLLLGELAWEEGAVARARRFWEKLIPVPAAGQLPQVLKYPDSDVDLPAVRARLILCSAMEGNLSRARSDIESSREHLSQAEGLLAGQKGNLLAIVKRIVEEQPNASTPLADFAVSTFAGNSERCQVLPKGIDVGGVLWSVPLKEMRIERTARADEFNLDRFERLERGAWGPSASVASYFPVTWQNVVLLCNETEISAWELTSGPKARPAWGNDATIYRLPPEFDVHASGSRLRAGLPRFSLSVDRGRVFARLGSVASPAVRNRVFRAPASVLVCLDLSRQGDLAWVVDSAELEVEGGNWIFDGPPLAADGRVYVALRRSDPQLQLSVACFDGANGRLLWNRKVCAGVEAFAGDVDEVRHQVLTWSDERLYYGTGLGAVISLDARDGMLRWAAAYPRTEIETVSGFNKQQSNGPAACVYHDGLIFTAPLDADRLYAYDAESGVLQWESGLNGRVPQLLGVAGKQLVAAGDLLWAIDVDTGRVNWVDGRGDPEAATAGRGLLAGDIAYWPRREEIRMVEISTGRVLRQVDLREQHGLVGGGNLLIANGMLLLVQPDRLVAFSQFGVLRKPASNDLALTRRGQRDR